MGTGISELLDSLYPPEPKWNEGMIPDLTGKVMIVTGGTSGIGKQTCSVLMSKGATVYLASRDAERSKATIAKLNSMHSKSDTDTKASLHFLQLDLASLDSIKAAAEEFKSKEERLDVLFNNAGVMDAPKGSTTEDGYEMHFGTNVLGHFAFTYHLLPLLLSTASLPTSPKGSVRIINTSSTAHRYCPPEGIDFSDPSMSLHGRASPSTLYGQSKLGNIVHASELARRYTVKGILSYSCHPGIIKSEVWRNSGFLKKLGGKALAYSPFYGAKTQLWLGTAGLDTKWGGDGVTIRESGGYGFPWCRWREPAHPKASDEEMAKMLWDWCEEQIQSHEER